MDEKGIAWFGPRGGGDYTTARNKTRCCVGVSGNTLRFYLGSDIVQAAPLNWSAGAQLVVGMDDTSFYLKKTQFKGFLLGQNPKWPGVFVVAGPQQLVPLFPWLKGSGRIPLNFFVRDGALAMHRPTADYVKFGRVVGVPLLRGSAHMVGPSAPLGLNPVPVRFICAECSVPLDGRGPLYPEDTAKVYVIVIPECLPCNEKKRKTSTATPGS